VGNASTGKAYHSRQSWYLTNSPKTSQPASRRSAAGLAVRCAGETQLVPLMSTTIDAQ